METNKSKILYIAQNGGGESHIASVDDMTTSSSSSSPEENIILGGHIDEMQNAEITHEGGDNNNTISSTNQEEIPVKSESFSGDLPKDLIPPGFYSEGGGSHKGNDDDDDNSSLCTEDIHFLSLCSRLRNFLESKDGESIISVLTDIRDQLKTLNDTLKKK